MPSLRRADVPVRGPGGRVAPGGEPGASGRTGNTKLDENSEIYTELVVERMGDYADTTICVCTGSNGDCCLRFRPGDGHSAGTHTRQCASDDGHSANRRGDSLRIVHH